jgi:hypothetical protein
MPRLQTHPGEILREEYLVPLGLSARALAKLQSRGPGYLRQEETGVPALRSGMKNAAPRPGHETCRRQNLMFLSVDNIPSMDL